MGTKVDKVEEAWKQLRDAETVFTTAEESLAAVADEMLSTPQRVVLERQRRDQVETAALTLIEKKEAFDRLAAKKAEQVKGEAARELAAVIPRLEEAATRAEGQMDALVATLTELVTLARQRYLATKRLTGDASPKLLLKHSTAGWVRYRLTPLDLPDMYGPAWFRRPLVEMLGLLAHEKGGET